MSTVYRDKVTRERGEMCIKEQGMIYTESADPQIGALGMGVIGGNWGDIDAVWSAVATGPNSALMADDGAMLAAVQAVWSKVAAARYPQAGAPTGVGLYVRRPDDPPMPNGGEIEG
jgi:hypothetical protein